MIENSQDCIYELDLSGRLIAMNSNALGQMEIEDFSIVHQSSWFSFWKGEDQQKARAAVQEALANGISRFHGYCPTAKGSPKWWDIVITPILDSTGKSGRLRVMSRDISELKQSEATLRRSEHDLADFFENTPVGLHCVGPDGKVLRVNKAQLEMLGYTSEEIIGHHIAEFHADQQIINDLLGGLSRGETVRDYPARLRGKDGSIKHVLIDSNVLWEEGRFVHTRCCTRDVTDRQISETILRDSQQRLGLALAAGQMGTWTRDLDGGNQVIWSPEMEAIFGLNPGEFSGTTEAFFDLVHPEDRELIVKAARQAVERKVDYEVEFRFLHRSGDVRWMLGRARAYPGGTGQPVRLAGVGIDVTERKQAEETLNAAQERLRHYAAELERGVAERTANLKQTNEQLEAFVYSIAHDLRSPLRAMEACSCMLIKDYGQSLDRTALDYARRINASAEFMDKLLLDLLEYGRAGCAELELGSVSVKATWEAAVLQCQHQIQEKRASLEVMEPLPVIRAHETMLIQILANLLSNALIFVAPQVRPEIRFLAQEEGAKVRLWIEDNGIGIPAEQHERIFRLFERLHGAAYGGTGIGLAIVRKGVERMGGRVGLESAPGQGSRFWIELEKA